MRVIVSSIAKQQLLDAVVWYQYHGMMHQDFLQAVRHAIERIQQHPTLYTKVDAKLRAILLPRFPYRIYYGYQPDLPLIEIVEVRHQRQNP
ncbi:type II toxin-antitoxin system RelE/ParE family toxin, partial [Arthrospira platensis SPKY1]|nr:type II toxin-antitoxin system RelE/ParE family toxin [Arthrospira platensis SPKY1]